VSNKPTRRDVLAGAAGGALISIAPGSALAALEEPATMPKRVLGKTGKEIPVLVFGGAVDLDRRFDPKLAEAVRHGVTYIDTADCYDDSELCVGSFLAKSGLRDQLWITSKSDLHDPAGFETVVNRSLERLGIETIDLYYLHMLEDPNFLNDKLLAKVEKLKGEGKFKHFGFSTHGANVPALLRKAAETPWVESVMFRYNFRKYGDEALNEAMDAAHGEGVGLIAMKTQGSEASFKDGWTRWEQTGKWNKHQAVIKAVLEDDRITAAISAMKNMDQLTQNVAAAADTSKLGALDRRSLQRYAEATRAYACDGCDHLCNPAVDAPVQIGTTMRALMYHDVYREPAKAHRVFGKLPEGAKKLARIDFSGANAACPHGVDVVAHMRRAADVLVG